MATIVDNLWEQLGSSTCEFLLCLLGRFILPWPTRSRGRLLMIGLMTWGRQRSSSLERRRRIVGMRSSTVSKNVAYGRQAIIGLVSRNVVNVRTAGQVRGLVGDMT